MPELGNREIHRRHSVMVEGGNVPRARVMDQTMIDRYLMDGLITLGQHQAGEFLLNQAAKAGIYAKGVNPDAIPGGEKNNVPMGIFPYGRTLALVKRRYGHLHSYLVNEVVCHNWDVSSCEVRMKMLKESLQLISDRRMSGGRSPVRHLKKRGG